MTIDRDEIRALVRECGFYPQPLAWFERLYRAAYAAGMEEAAGMCQRYAEKMDEAGSAYGCVDIIRVAAQQVKGEGK